MFYFNLQNVTFNDIFIIFVWVETPTYNLRLLHPYANPLDSSQEPFGLVGSQTPDSPNNTKAGMPPCFNFNNKKLPRLSCSLAYNGIPDFLLASKSLQQRKLLQPQLARAGLSQLVQALTLEMPT